MARRRRQKASGKDNALGCLGILVICAVIAVVRYVAENAATIGAVLGTTAVIAGGVWIVAKLGIWSLQRSREKKALEVIGREAGMKAMSEEMFFGKPTTAGVSATPRSETSAHPNGPRAVPPSDAARPRQAERDEDGVRYFGFKTNPTTSLPPVDPKPASGARARGAAGRRPTSENEFDKVFAWPGETAPTPKADPYSTPDVTIRPIGETSAFKAPSPPPTPKPKAEPYAAMRPIAATTPFRSDADAHRAPVAIRWIKPGETVSIGGVTLSSGMFYFGEAPTDPNSIFRQQPAIVNPSLPVAAGRSLKGAPPTYYPSYFGIQPEQRRGFLEWMAAGRADPDENLSLVFLFVYGLELRLFREAAYGDAAQIIDEAQRLMILHGGRGSFGAYVGHFLRYAHCLLPGIPIPPLSTGTVPQEMPLDAKYHLGSKLAHSQTITADDALIWAVSSPEVWRRRWPDERRDVFRDLWKLRFDARYPAGLRVAEVRDTIKAVYRPSSRSFEAPIHGPFERLPDVSKDSATAERLKDLVEQCHDELGSRSANAKPKTTAKPSVSSKPSPPSPTGAFDVLTLPKDLWIARSTTLFGAMANRLASEGVNGTVLTLRLIDVFEMAKFAVSVSPKSTRDMLSRLSEGLWTVGVGIEPDGNDPDVDVTLERPACLFRLPTECRGTGYRETVDSETRLVVDLAVAGAMIAEVDGPEIRRRVASAVLEGSDADRLERARLEAYASIASPDPVRVPRLVKAAAKLTPGHKEVAARVSVVAVSTLSRLPVLVVRHLEKVQKALDLPIEGLHAALHRVQAAYAEPPLAPIEVEEIALDAVKRGMEGGSPAGESGSEPVRIDPVRLAQRKRETEAVATALADVFSESSAAEEKSEPAKAKVSSASGPFEGLDADHGALLAAVLDVPAMSKEDFEAHAKARKLLADGAIERINDWAFDVFDGAVLEDGDEICVPPNLRDRVMEMRRT